MKVVGLDLNATWPHNLRAIEVPEPPEPGTGEVLVAVDAFPINPADLMLINGPHPLRSTLAKVQAGNSSQAYRLLGAEGAARVLRVGPGVDDLAVGQRVLMLSRSNWVERAVVKRSDLVAISVTLETAQLAMLKVNPCTAWLLLESAGPLQPGDWLAQTAANSAVGKMVIRMAAKKGLRTVNIVRRAEAADACRSAGADTVVIDGPDLRRQVQLATEGAPIRVGLDAVGGETTMRLAQCLADRSPLLLYGYMSGDSVSISSHDVVARAIRLIGFRRAEQLPTTTGELQNLLEKIAQMVADGVASTKVEATYQLEEIVDAVVHAGRRNIDGKVIVATPAVS